MPKTAERLSRIAFSSINEMVQMARRHDAINLASGTPDFDPPQELITAVGWALERGYHQYARMSGSPRFCEALARKQAKFTGLPIDPDGHITVTCGGTEAMMLAMMTVCNPGDKVIVLSPFYENASVDPILCGAQPIYVALRPPDFVFDLEELRRAFEQKPKAIVFSNPSNPCGRVFTPAELQVIADLAQEFDAFVIVDEVYEHIIYPPHEHVYVAALPGMFERTLSCGSLSKTYHMTGWRLGYLISPPGVTQEAHKVHDFLTLGTSALLQEAAVTALEFPESYYHDLAVEYALRRDFLLGALEAAGFDYIQPQGAFYVLMDISPFGFEDDRAFCHWLVEQIGLATVPGSYFFHEPVGNYVRLNFAKRDETLQAARECLLRLAEAVRKDS
jgi:aminotransferase